MAILLLLAAAMPLTAGSLMERCKKVLRQTALDFNLNPAVSVAGKEGQEFYTINLSHPENGISLGCMVFRDKEAKKSLFKVAKGFGEMAKGVYGTMPKIVKTTRVLEGVKVAESDCPAHVYKNDVMKWTVPRTRGMRVDITPLISFSVTSTGGPDPAPYMVKLLKNLKAEGLSASVNSGVSFRLLVKKQGFISKSRIVDTGNISPSSITVSGRVVDVRGKPVPGARVAIGSLKETVETDTDGYFRLFAETEGEKPFSVSLTMILDPSVNGIKISFKNPKLLPVPGNSVIKILVRNDKGNPITSARIKLKWTVPDFVTHPAGNGTLNKNGILAVPIIIRTPADPGRIDPDPSSLRLKLDAEVRLKDTGKSAFATLSVPLNLSMIIGTTVGPDMKPRPETAPPGLFLMNAALFVANWKDNAGAFRILVHPQHPVSGRTAKKWWIAWGDRDRLPLELPVPEAPAPGKIVDVGLVDVLTPDEHVTRLRNVAAEFFAAMPLTPSEQSRIQTALRRIVFVDGGMGNVPYFTDNFTDDSGIIHIPDTSKKYWSENLREDNDAGYEIIPHELGHFAHHNLVERFSYINMCYNKLSTGLHSTWKTEPGQLPLKLPFISFSENTADFFALLFRRFWLSRHPEIKDSVYFKRIGYLTEFETDEKAMKVVGNMEPGYMIEGVQTRFLRVFYGRACQNQPGAVFSDYLNTMLLYMDRPQGWLGSLVNRPARTIYQWIESKNRMPGTFGPADPVALAARYRLIPGMAPAPTAAMGYGEKTAALKINGKAVDFGQFPVVPVPFGSRLNVTEGMISIDLSDMDNRRTVVLKAPAEIMLKSRTEITVFRGLAGIDFPAVLAVPGGKVTPLGTVVQVIVNRNGVTEISTLEGKVQVVPNAGSVKQLKTGELLTLDKNGILTVISHCNPEKKLRNLLPETALLPVPVQKNRSGISPVENLRHRLSSFPWWALVGIFSLVFLILTTIAWLLRRLLAALIISPFAAAGVLAMGQLILKPAGNENLSFGSLFVSPWTAWNTSGDWLPAAAWLLGGLIAGFIVRGYFRGLIAGLLVPLLPWILFSFPANAEIPATIQTALSLGEQMLRQVQLNFPILLAVTGLGGGIGGLLLPKKKQMNSKTHSSRHVRRDYNDPDDARDNGYGHSVDDNNFFDQETGDDGDDE
ncbi:MAG: hypothetical protein GXO69_05245 [Acidobacteria bacterium]|nr:hypothetical protein [Acidobacteriota bacterium]